MGLLIACNCYAASQPSIDSGDSHKGVVHIAYKGTPSKRVKVIIEKGSKKYTYDLKNTGEVEDFPLQMGNGTYAIKVLENTAETSYCIVGSQTVEVKLQDENSVYLNTIQNMKWSEDSKAIKKAIEMTNTTRNLQEKANILYEHMVQSYTYDYYKLAKLPSTYLPVIDQTFKDKTGICYDFSSLYGAMLRSQGIPAKLIKGYTPNAEGYHAWNEVYDQEKQQWLIIDTTYDLQVVAKKKDVKMTKSEKDYQKVNEY